MDAKVTVQFILPHMCSPEDLISEGKSFEEMVRYLIFEEGLWGLCQDDWEIIKIEETLPGSGGNDGAIG